MIMTNYRLMRNRLFYAALCSCLGVIVLMGQSCKKKKEDHNFDKEDELVRLRTYQEVHYPKATSLGDNGFYIHLKEGNGEPLQELKWFEADLLVFNLNGDFQYTTMRNIATQQKVVHPLERYVPKITHLAPNTLGETLYQVLQKARIGDSILVGMSSEAVTSFNQWKNPAYTSSLLTIIPRKLIKDPEVYEKEIIDEYVKNHPSFSVHEDIYREVISQGQGALINDEHELWIEYAGYFLDGALFDTNSREVALRHNFSLPSATPLFMKARGDERMINGFSGAFHGLPVGSKVRILVPSALAYGKKGKGSIRPYEPLIFEVSIIRHQ